MLDNIIAAIADPQFLLSAIAGMLAFATVLTLVGPMMGGNRFAGRLKAVSSRREQLRRQSREALTRDPKNSRGLRQVESRGIMRKVVDRLKLQKLLEDPKLNEKLLQAGLRGQAPAVTFYFARFVLPIVLCLITLFYLFFLNDMGKPAMMRVGIGILALAVGYYLPGVWLTNLAHKRRDSIMTAFPDALDLLLICVESGMSIEAAFQKVAGEIGTQSLELAEELHLTTAELAYLQDRRSAYENLAKRTNHEGVKGVAVALVQAEKYGTPLGAALRVMAKENRDMRLSAAEKKAAALPAKLTVPMIIFFLPVLFVVIIGPAIIQFQTM